MITTVLDQQQRNGTVDTGSAPVPLNGDGSLATNPDTGAVYQFMHGRAIMGDADALDVTKLCQIGLWVSFDGGLTYTTDPAWQLTWQGGTLDKRGNPNVPDFSFSFPGDANGNPPSRVRARVDTQGTLLNFGYSIEFR